MLASMEPFLPKTLFEDKGMHKAIKLKRPLTDAEYERVARRFGWTSTDPNGYTSVLHIANPDCFDKICQRCGKIAAWSAGMPPDHFLCLRCADAWHKWPLGGIKNGRGFKSSWEKVFGEFLKEME